MSRQKRLKKLKSYRFKGFKIIMYRNHLRSHPFEFKLVPITQEALSRTKVHGHLRKVIHDPTSMRTRKSSFRDAKEYVKGIKQPFFY